MPTGVVVPIISGPQVQVPQVIPVATAVPLDQSNLASAVPVAQVQAVPSYATGTPVSAQPIPVQTQAWQAGPMHMQDHSYVGQQPETYSMLAWFSCLCCCWPIGLLAVLSSTQVISAIREGDRERAEKASQRTKQIAMCSILVGTLFFFVSARRAQG